MSSAGALLRPRAESATFSVIFKDTSKNGLARRVIGYDNPYFTDAAREAALAALRFTSDPKAGYAIILRCDGSADLTDGCFKIHHTRDIP